MSVQELEGTWEEVQQRLQKLPFEKGQQVRIIVTESSPVLRTPNAPHSISKPLTFGMFPQLADLTDEDFKSAEYHGDVYDL